MKFPWRREKPQGDTEKKTLEERLGPPPERPPDYEWTSPSGLRIAQAVAKGLNKAVLNEDEPSS